MFSSGRWYLIAWELDAEEWRVFRIDRLTPGTPTGPRFATRALPGAGPHEFLIARFTGSEDGTTWPCTGEAVLGLPARKVLPFVQDGTVEELAPNQCRLTLGAWSWVAVAAQIARFDAPIEKVAPAELADAFALLSERFSQLGPRQAD